MRWLVRGLVVLSVLQFAYIYRLIHHTDEPVSMDIDCNQVPTAKDQAPVSPAVEVPEASPLCGVSLKDVAIFGA